LLSSPLRDRFGFVHRLEFYTEKELVQIISRSAHILGLKIDPAAAAEIARRSRGTPRVANRILRRVRDFAQVAGKDLMDLLTAQKALDLLAVDDFGLTAADRQLLRGLAEKHQGGPVGVETLAATINEDIGTVETVYEPYLMQIGLLKRTARGRQLTPAAFDLLKLPLPAKYQQEKLL
jgi:Holliday junction DNA helicase RuvB